MPSKRQSVFTYIDQFAKNHGEYSPDRSIVLLPAGMTIQKLWENYNTQCVDGEGMECSLSFFCLVFREELSAWVKFLRMN